MATLLVLGAAALPGCTAVECNCSQAAPFLMIAVRDALDAGPIATALVNDVPCGASGVCQFRSKPDGGPPSAGPISLEAAAGGYRSQGLIVYVPAATPVQTECCGPTPPYVSQSRTVLLEPL
ncbi:MAG TPA: hypothetical protein VLQ79_06085 [Myxococcaceae bacterium]|nr:hypothetical protein [Myxococcaceae bacterium]